MIDSLAARVAMPVMEDGPSVVLFVIAVVAVSLVAAVVLPAIFRRLPLRYGVPALALIGPFLAIIGSLIGTGAMTLSGRDIWYALLVAACSGAAAIVVGLRLARPVARDLDVIAGAVEAVAEGDRSARTGIERADEIGKLASTVDELSRSLARAETERAAADEERRSVVSALSHDLRTPLASLLVSVDALADGIGDPENHIWSMRGNVLALERLVGDLFLLARADSGRLALDSEPLDLAELIDEAVEAVEPIATAKQVRFATELEGAIPVVRRRRGPRSRAQEPARQRDPLLAGARRRDDRRPLDIVDGEDRHHRRGTGLPGVVRPPGVRALLPGRRREEQPGWGRPRTGDREDARRGPRRCDPGQAWRRGRGRDRAPAHGSGGARCDRRRRGRAPQPGRVGRAGRTGRRPLSARSPGV